MPADTDQHEAETAIDGGDDDFNDVHDDGNDGDEEEEFRGHPVDWVTIATFTVSTAVHLARIRLESEDIPCLILNENTAITLWHYALATGGIKLQVPREDAERASTLLATPAKPPIDDDEQLMKCPLCGSNDFVDEHLTFRRFVTTFLLILIGFGVSPLAGIAMLCCAACFIFSTPRRKCAECGRIWPAPTLRGFEVEMKTKPGETSEALPLAKEIDPKQ